MNATTVAVDLAKSVFALAVADEHWKVVGPNLIDRLRSSAYKPSRVISRPLRSGSTQKGGLLCRKPQADMTNVSMRAC
jgi:hypothetical protein